MSHENNCKNFSWLVLDRKRDKKVSSVNGPSGWSVGWNLADNDCRQVTRGRKGWLRVMMEIRKIWTYPRREGTLAEAVGQSVQWSEVERWIAHGPMDKEMESLFFAQVFPFFAWRVVVRCRWFYFITMRVGEIVCYPFSWRFSAVFAGKIPRGKGNRCWLLGCSHRRAFSYKS